MRVHSEISFRTIIRFLSQFLPCLITYAQQGYCELGTSQPSCEESSGQTEKNEHLLAK